MNVKSSVMAVRPVEMNLTALFFVSLKQVFCWLISRQSHFPASINQYTLDVRDPLGLMAACSISIVVSDNEEQMIVSNL